MDKGQVCGESHSEVEEGREVGKKKKETGEQWKMLGGQPLGTRPECISVRTRVFVHSRTAFPRPGDAKRYSPVHSERRQGSLLPLSWPPGHSGSDGRETSHLEETALESPTLSADAIA